MDEIILTVHELEIILTAGNKVGHFIDRGNLQMAKQYADDITNLAYRKLTAYAKDQAQQDSEDRDEPVEPFRFTQYCSSDDHIANDMLTRNGERRESVERSG